MRIHYLEIVTDEVDQVCQSYQAAFGVEFSSPDPLLGHARTADMPDGSLVGVRAPMAESEQAVVRPYWLVSSIDEALEAAERASALVAHPPMELPGKGKFAIYIQGEIQHGLWELQAPAPAD